MTEGNTNGARDRAKRLQPDFETVLDAHFTQLVTSPTFPVPGLVVLARRGSDIYHRAFGVSDLETRAPMRTDAMFRMYSMTKVLTSFVALRLYEHGLLAFDDRSLTIFLPSAVPGISPSILKMVQIASTTAVFSPERLPPTTIA